MYYWQVRKYPPLKEGEENKPKIPTWTSIIDIGRTYNGVSLTMSEYLSVEEKYVKAVEIYMKSIQVHELEIYLMSKLREELFAEHILKYPKCYSQEIVDFYYFLQDGSLLTGKQIEHIVRLGMRENIACQLRNGNKFFLNFSYDYYMDIGSSVIREDAIMEIRNLGLFIDLWEWPYEGNVWENSVE
ncbi:hypothetical protein [Paenibacillus oleatilyticus]|uniref:Uncharacterized protein n=1 Tax=Paenibacillus oleatilyticus TaxID=2594886 RepID=A0ABV4V588_9BACL